MILSEIIDLFKELLITWINAIIYYHGVYPKFVFEDMKSFNLICPFSRSPKLSHYIFEFVNTVTRLIVDARAVKVLVILHKNHHHSHHYIIECSDLVVLTGKEDSHVEIDTDSLYLNFNSFLFYHIQHLKTVMSANDLEFKLLLDTDIEKSNDKWVVTDYRPLNNVKVLDEVSTGILNFSSIHEFT